MGERLTAIVDFLEKEDAEQKARRKVHNDVINQRKMLGLSVRQMKRLCRSFKAEGMAGLVSRKRGRPSNRKLSADLQTQAVSLVRERYSDFGPKLAHEKLLDVHGVRVGRETLRNWLSDRLLQ